MLKRFNLLFVIVFFALFMNLFSQTIVSERWYGGDYNDIGYGAVQLDDGGFLITGIYQESYYNDIYLIRTNAEGDTIWTRTYGGVSWDNGMEVIATLDSNYLICGRTFSSGSANSGDVCLIKVDNLGNLIWQKNFGSSRKDGSYSVVQACDSGFVFTGQYNYSDLWAVKTDAKGVEKWSRTYGPVIGYKIIETADKHYLMTGAVGSPNKMYIAKLDSSNGDTLWTCTLGGNDVDFGYDICNTSDGGFLVLGTTKSSGAGGYDVYLAEITSDGDTLSTRTYGFAQDEYGYSIAQTPDSGYIVCGSTTSIGAGLGDIYVLKLDANLDTVWTKAYGGEGNDWANQVICSGEGSYTIIGSTQSYGSAGDIYFLNIIESELAAIDATDESLIKTPLGYHLSQNYPNPFNPSTTISFTLPANEFVEITLHNLTGQVVGSVFAGHKTAGTHFLTVDASNLASGVYFYTIAAGKFHQTKKMILMR